MAESWMPSARLQELCQDQRERWQHGDKPRVETYLDRYPELHSDEKLLLDFICAEYSLRAELGESPALAEYVECFPQLAPQLKVLFELLTAIDGEPSLPPSEQEVTSGSGDAVSPNVPQRAFQRSPKVLSTVIGEMPPENVNSVIGPYKLLQKLGEGGMGTVWVADQSEPVKRRVALKLIKIGLDTTAVLRRFEAERQALALMDHQNIAKVLDAGTTSQGRPYFAMELIKGLPITKYCDHEHLTPRERLELFIPICQAVQHAHQKGVIHRDLKPSNVLIALYDGKPVPKISTSGSRRRPARSSPSGRCTRRWGRSSARWSIWPLSRRS